MHTAEQILIVEDIAETRMWLAEIARSVFEVEPVLAANLTDARTWCVTRIPGPLTALVDVGLPDGSGLELVAALAAGPAATVIVTTIFENDEVLTAALAAGADGYLLKSSGPADIAARLRAMRGGEVALSPAMARRLLDRFRAPARGDLTPRESDVLGLIGRGLTLAEAGSVLGISGQTVATHVKAIYRKLDITSRAEAALEAHQRGLA